MMRDEKKRRDIELDTTPLPSIRGRNSSRVWSPGLLQELQQLAYSQSFQPER